ncbi:L-lysine exporter family protein LysE/ArgO [Rhizobium tibeticum]|uniref:Arginine exporter protein n=1 Tax=Rhizobium tibeticum TaxID=501024 RepID=A0A1H8GBF5_9HYPH|nr:arginine exporter protein [Rhizobium tibeticum]SEN41075.1 L-lysine exporter family protein LysE/ArgO [Rhizobium tibeticum]
MSIWTRLFCSAACPQPIAARTRLAYGLGAATSSFVWFFGLEYGARLLQPVFAKPAAWRVLDIIIGVVMGLLAISLVVRFLAGS